MKIKWEDITSDWSENVRDYTERLKVFGGWIIRCRSVNYSDGAALSESSVFIPDPDHKWVV